VSTPTFSVIIPLYNKKAEVAATLRSALEQSLRPLEVIVVDDGSTDGSADIVAAFRSPLVRLIRQPNAGVSAARNRAIAEARGEYVALLDADDRWRTGFLAEITAMIERWPGCGLYATAFDIVSGEGLVPGRTPNERGPVDDFFTRSMSCYVAIPSASVIPRALFAEVGLFPVGMKLGEDQYLWTRIARCRTVCFSPERLVLYSRVASNRSNAVYTPERSLHTLEELYDPAASEASNEYVARVALGKALVISAKGGTDEAARTARFFGWTRLNRRLLRKVRILNALPAAWRPAVLDWYNRLAWRLARKGL
jgi:glycosyltransferase involved in cell wall biosynthesis